MKSKNKAPLLDAAGQVLRIGDRVIHDHRSAEISDLLPDENLVELFHVEEDDHLIKIVFRFKSRPYDVQKIARG